MYTKCTNADQMFASIQRYSDSIIQHGNEAIVLISLKEMVSYCGSNTYLFGVWSLINRKFVLRMKTSIYKLKKKKRNKNNKKIHQILLADTATMVEIDHDAQDYTEFQMHSTEFNLDEAENINGQRRLSELNGIAPSIESVAARLHAPVTSNRIDMDKISFERNKTGIWGWRSDKNENINGYDCKVYAASNVEFVTRTRGEHLNESQARVRFLTI